MNPPNPPSPRRRRRWPWILAILGSPVLLLALAAVSYLSLQRDAAILRSEVMAATASDWHTKIQLSAGRFTFWIIRSCLAFGSDEKVREARAALNAVRSVSVGVYRRSEATSAFSREQLFNQTDRTMQQRGWTRLVGVADRRENVLIYVPTDSAEPSRVCLAVVHGRELVVVSARLNPAALAELVANHAVKKLRPKLAARRT
jgi:hypothetical protein